MYAVNKKDLDDTQKQFLSAFAEQQIKLFERKLSESLQLAVKQGIAEISAYIKGLDLKRELQQLSSIAEQGKEQLSSIAEQGKERSKQQILSLAEQSRQRLQTAAEISEKKIAAQIAISNKAYDALAGKTTAVDTSIQERLGIAQNKVRDIVDSAKTIESHLQDTANKTAERISKNEERIKDHVNTAINASALAKSCAKELEEAVIKLQSVDDMKAALTELQTSLAQHLNQK